MSAPLRGAYFPCLRSYLRRRANLSIRKYETGEHVLYPACGGGDDVPRCLNRIPRHRLHLSGTMSPGWRGCSLILIFRRCMVNYWHYVSTERSDEHEALTKSAHDTFIESMTADVAHTERAVH